jgi:hypothetical protein
MFSCFVLFATSWLIGRLMKKPTSALIPSPGRGRTKVGVINLIIPKHPYPGPYPIKGKGASSKMQRYASISFSVGGRRKIMNHFLGYIHFSFDCDSAALSSP